MYGKIKGCPVSDSDTGHISDSDADFTTPHQTPHGHGKTPHGKEKQISSSYGNRNRETLLYQCFRCVMIKEQTTRKNSPGTIRNHEVASSNLASSSNKNSLKALRFQGVWFFKTLEAFYLMQKNAQKPLRNP